LQLFTSILLLVLASPEAEAFRAGLSEQQCLKLKDIDITGLQMASRSFARKRAAKEASTSFDTVWLRIRTSFLRQEWFARIFRLRAIGPKNRKDPMR